MIREVLSGQMTYKDAGVDVAAADEAVARIWKLAERTLTDKVIHGVGPFCAAISLDKRHVVVASADGLGTKAHICAVMGRYELAGEDIVAHSVNDILTIGATPLFFLDYIASSSLTLHDKEGIVEGIVRGCERVGCALVGGETADMPGTYYPGYFDLVGFIVGLVDRDKTIDGKLKINEGDVLIGMPSAGLHTNGYALARKVFGVGLGGDPDEERERLARTYPGLDGTLADALLAPHRCYYNELKPLLPQLKGIAHITGGGLPGNVPRILPEGLAARIDRSAWEVPPIFRLIQERGNIAEEEMYRTFNMGIGLVLAVAPADVDAVRSQLPKALVLGEVVGGTGVVWR